MTDVDVIDVTVPEFAPWPKTPRYFRHIIITEKIDGTNGCIVLTQDGDLFVQSRSRFIFPEHHDNHGFARWVYENRKTIERDLGVGRHYGEWWGSGIQRGYGLDKGDKRFSLFNTSKWYGVVFETPGLSSVPVIESGTHTTYLVDVSLYLLRSKGSFAAPGYPNPEGVCIFHTASNEVYKATLLTDGEAKSEAVALSPLSNAAA